MRKSPFLELHHLTRLARHQHDAVSRQTTHEDLRVQLEAYAGECRVLERMLATLADAPPDDVQRKTETQDGATLAKLRAAEDAIIDACDRLVTGQELSMYQLSVVRRLRSLSAERRGWLRSHSDARAPENRRTCA